MSGQKIRELKVDDVAGASVIWGNYSSGVAHGMVWLDVGGPLKSVI
jgi:hypothetical protein